jgi:hypothetical protein
MADDPLDFGVDLATIRDRLDLLGYFLSVTDILQASDALDETIPASPPAAFVAVARESAEPNKTIGGHSQRVAVEVAVLFVELAARFDRQAKDRLEQTRKAVTRQLVAWKAGGTEHGLEYRGYRVVAIGNGLVWGEVTFSTSYRLSI